MILRSVITETGFENVAPKVYGRNDWDKSPLFIGISWALERAPRISNYPKIQNTPLGPLRYIRTRPTMSNSEVTVYFYEAPNGNVHLVDAIRVP